MVVARAHTSQARKIIKFWETINIIIPTEGNTARNTTILALRTIVTRRITDTSSIRAGKSAVADEAHMITTFKTSNHK